MMPVSENLKKDKYSQQVQNRTARYFLSVFPLCHRDTPPPPPPRFLLKHVFIMQSRGLMGTKSDFQVFIPQYLRETLHLVENIFQKWPIFVLHCNFGRRFVHRHYVHWCFVHKPNFKHVQFLFCCFQCGGDHISKLFSYFNFPLLVDVYS